MECLALEVGANTEPVMIDVLIELSAVRGVLTHIRSTTPGVHRPGDPVTRGRRSTRCTSNRAVRGRTAGAESFHSKLRDELLKCGGLRHAGGSQNVGDDLALGIRTIAVRTRSLQDTGVVQGVAVLARSLYPYAGGQRRNRVYSTAPVPRMWAGQTDFHFAAVFFKLIVAGFPIRGVRGFSQAT